MSFAIALHPLCLQAQTRTARPGPAQWSGVQLTRHLEAPARETARVWRGSLLERALLGYLFDVAAQRADRSSAGELSHAVVLRHGQPFRRFCDLAHDLAEGRRTADALSGLCPWPGAPMLESRHVAALRKRLEKPAQRRNLNRLMAHSTRLSEMTESKEAMAHLGSVDTHLGHALLTWTLVGRFQPIRFHRSLGLTRATIASLYMSERELCAYADVDEIRAVALRARLVAAIRGMNARLGWTRMIDAFPERLAMTQGDLRNKRRKGPPSAGGSSDLDAALRELAERNTERDGDAALWEAIAAHPALFSRYTHFRHEAELAAELNLSPSVSRQSWWTRGLMWSAAAAAATGVVVWGWPEPESVPPIPAAAPEAPGDAELAEPTRTVEMVGITTLKISGELAHLRVVRTERLELGLVEPEGCGVTVRRNVEVLELDAAICQAPLEIQVPRGVAIEVVLAAGDVELDTLNGTARVELATGSLRGDNLNLEHLELELGSVELELTGVLHKASLNAGMSRGVLTLESLPQGGLIAVELGLGDLVVEVPEGASLGWKSEGLRRVKSVLSSRPDAGFQVSFSSALGELEIRSVAGAEAGGN